MIGNPQFVCPKIESRKKGTLVLVNFVLFETKALSSERTGNVKTGNLPVRES